MSDEAHTARHSSLTMPYRSSRRESRLKVPLKWIYPSTCSSRLTSAASVSFAAATVAVNSVGDAKRRWSSCSRVSTSTPNCAPSAAASEPAAPTPSPLVHGRKHNGHYDGDGERADEPDVTECT